MVLSDRIAQAWYCPALTAVYVPSQLLPSPTKPGPHAHEKLPGVLVHAALASQSESSAVHSSTSAQVCLSP